MFKIIFVAIVLVSVVTSYYQDDGTIRRRIPGRTRSSQAIVPGVAQRRPSPRRFNAAAAAGVQDSGFDGQPQGQPEPHNFAYETTDEFGTRLYRTEDGDTSGTVRGTYGYQDANGIYRMVDYVADANGFRATIRTNEPGTKTSNPADASYQVEGR